MSKLSAYGGFARHPFLGDIHGLVRVVAVARNRHAARRILLRAGFLETGLLEPSRSYIERAICGWPKAWDSTAIFYCPLPLLYLAAEHYRVPPAPRKRCRKKT